MKRPAVFVDRDGTINEQMGYINHISRFSLLPRVPEAIRLLNQHQYLTIVVSNQSGVARGYFPIMLVEEVHVHMKGLLEKDGAFIDGIFFCPHHPRGIVPEYQLDCDCRKPKPGLIFEACKSFDIDMANSFIIGDRYTDMELAHGLRLKGILVRTGYGLGEINYVLPRKTQRPHHIAEDLLQGVHWILGREQGQ